MWEVHYSQEAATYLEDNGALIAGLFFAMEALSESEGLPVVGEFQVVQGAIFWLIQGHQVIYRRLESAKIVRILSIKPA